MATPATVEAPLVDHHSPRRPRAARRAGAKAERWAGLILASPALLVFTVFMFVPLVLTFWYSLHRYRGFGTMRWVGAENYRAIAQDATFWKALLNTVALHGGVRPTRYRARSQRSLAAQPGDACPGTVPGLFYVPVVISGVASGVIFLRLFDPVIGLINQLLDTVGLPVVNWQGSGPAALASIIVVTTWQGIGFAMVVYLAGLQGIPGELYEAAAVDGAVGWSRFRRITWPLLGPTTFFLIVYSIILSFQVFDVVYVMTRGGPGTSTTFLVQYAYDQGFNQRRQGYAAAIGVIIYILVLLFTVAQWRLSRNRDEA
jgi:ABC-type sugar transport system permease subunit